MVVDLGLVTFVYIGQNFYQLQLCKAFAGILVILLRQKNKENNMGFIDYYMPFSFGNIDKGTHIDEVPRHSLEWLLEQDWLDKWNNLEDAIDDQLAMRDRSHVQF